MTQEITDQSGNIINLDGTVLVEVGCIIVIPIQVGLLGQSQQDVNLCGYVSDADLTVAVDITQQRQLDGIELFAHEERLVGFSLPVAVETKLLVFHVPALLSIRCSYWAT